MLAVPLCVTDDVLHPIANRDPLEEKPEAKPRAQSLNIARKLVNAHLRRFSFQPVNDPQAQTQIARALPSQQNDSTASPLDENGKDAANQEGLLGIIMDVCKLHVNDAIHHIQRPIEPGRSSTFGTTPARERQPSYLNLDSDEDDENSTKSLTQGSNAGLGDASDQWANEKEQTRTHLTEIIRNHIGRHLYLIRLCRALMLYGAPTHRLEE